MGGGRKLRTDCNTVVVVIAVAGIIVVTVVIPIVAEVAASKDETIDVSESLRSCNEDESIGVLNSS